MPTVPALDQVFAETVALFQSLRVVAAKIHSNGDLEPEAWTILQGLGRDGARTIADLANDCGVTKQQIQKLVKALEKEGAVERIKNPENRRARLISLSGDGRERIRAMDEREVNLLSQLPLDASESDLRAAARALAAVRRAMADEEWAKLLGNGAGG